MSKNLGNDVSKVLDNTSTNFKQIVFQQHRPPLDSEWNLVQDILLDEVSNTLKQIVPSGFLYLQDIVAAPSDRTLLNSSWQNVVILKNPRAIVNGWHINLGGGTGQFQENAQYNIWKTLSNNPEEIVIIGPDAPHLGYREDFIFLEVWQKLITPADTIYNKGFVQSALPNLTNDIIDSDIGIETSKRVQIQHRIRWVKGVDFISYRNGLGFPGIFPQGPLDAEDTDYTFQPHAKDPGLFIAGDGSATAQTDLKTVDGFIYAIPIARVHRRNQEMYTTINQNGALKSLLSGELSERPDGLYYDEVSQKDIEDLRHIVNLKGFDLDSILNQNLDFLFSNRLPSELKNSKLDDNSAGNIIIQIDGISNQTNQGVDEGERDPDGVKRVFSEALETQKFTFYIADTPNLINNKLVFVPIGKQTDNREYELFNENKFYVSTKEPYVKITRGPFADTHVTGTWEGLGEERPWNYISGPDKNKIKFSPNVGFLAALANQLTQISVEFEYKVREGGGLSGNLGGLKHPIHRMLKGQSTTDGKPIDFNLYTATQSVVNLESPRQTGSYKDSAIARSISHFEEATNPASTSKSKFKGGVVELKYYKLSNGSTSDSLPSTLYGRTVLSILSIFNITTSNYLIPSSIVLEDGINIFTANGLTLSGGDIIEYTILLGDYSVDITPHTRGIRNMVRSYSITHNPLDFNDTPPNVSGRLCAKNYMDTCDGILSFMGFYDGVQYRHVAYLLNSSTSKYEMIFLDSVDGLGTANINFSYTVDTGYVHTALIFRFLGYFNPRSTDSMQFQYEYIPYPGIINTRLNNNQIQKVKILKMNKDLIVTTAGTGSVTQNIPTGYLSFIQNLPINKKILEYNFFGENIISPFSGGTSSIRKLPVREVISNEDHKALTEGMIIDLKADAGTRQMYRGVYISSPKIKEQGLSFNPPFNHVTIWTGIVEGLDALKGELFLMVITTTSTIYNLAESPNDKYQELKGTYKDLALGKGSETILNNTVSATDISQNLGEKIIGAVDLFPLKYRPLIIPS